MRGTYNIGRARSKLTSLVREVKQGGMATITRHDKPISYILGADELRATIETVEILVNPIARKAIEDAESNQGITYSLRDLSE